MSDFATQREMMVDSQIRPSDVTKYPVIEAMLEIPREIFVPDEKRPVAYQDENIEIAPGRVLLALAPNMPQPYGEVVRLQGRYGAFQDADMMHWKRFK